MPTICLFFTVHQPYRLKNYPYDRIGKDHGWEDVPGNIARINHFADFCYLPANQTLLELIQRTDGRFKFAFCISGITLEQFFRYRPDVLESFRQLSETGCVEFVAETYYHSPAACFSFNEFSRQVVKQEKAILHLLDVRPGVLCIPGMVLQEELLPVIEALGYPTVLAERTGEKDGSEGFSSNPKVHLLVRNAVLSEDFGALLRGYSSDNLQSARTFSEKISHPDQHKSCISLGLSYESLASGQGLIKRADYEEVINHPDLHFVLPSDASEIPSGGNSLYSNPDTALQGRKKNIAPWNSNHLQRDTLHCLYALESELYQSGRPEMLDLWGRLQTLDHFLSMNHHQQAEEKHFIENQQSSPYDAYINYMNVLSDFKKLMKSH